ncbi:hypothetical protein M1349_05510 [Patescibacteria group bacterium]|nr:hypothetical protein [Patescibacteria group bacterium]
MEFNTDRKKEIENKILDLILEGLKKDLFSPQDAAKISSFVLVKISLVLDQATLVNFLYDLSENWPEFTSLYEIEDGKIERKLEQNVVTEALALVKEGKIDEALTLTKTVENS